MRPRDERGRFLPKNAPPRRRGGSRSSRPGGFLPAAGSEVELAYSARFEALKKEQRRRGRKRPVKVFYVVDGQEQRRFDVETWDAFMSDEKYGKARDEMLEDGEFWLAYEAPDGSIDEPIVQLT